VLRENSPELNPDLIPRLQPFTESGFLDIDVWNGGFSQRSLGEACTDEKLAGKYSWIGFPDVDEFIIMYQECATKTTPHACAPSTTPHAFAPITTAQHFCPRSCQCCEFLLVETGAPAHVMHSPLTTQGG
jgi:hypothetical protein